MKNSYKNWIQIPNLQWTQPHDNRIRNSYQSLFQTHILWLKICPQMKNELSQKKENRVFCCSDWDQWNNGFKKWNKAPSWDFWFWDILIGHYKFRSSEAWSSRIKVEITPRSNPLKKVNLGWTAQGRGEQRPSPYRRCSYAKYSGKQQVSSDSTYIHILLTTQPWVGIDLVVKSTLGMLELRSLDLNTLDLNS